jgi:hypothetical protein
MKESDIGREGSKRGIGEFLEVKYLCWAASTVRQISKFLGIWDLGIPYP